MTTTASGVTRSIARAAGLILVITVFARVVGFLRYLVFGASVGAGDVGTAYASANLVPNLLFEVAAGGALAATVIPLVAGLVERGEQAVDRDRDGAVRTVGDGPERANKVISALLGWTVLVTVTLALLVVLFARPVATLVLGSGEEGPAALATRLLRVFAPQIPLYGIAIVLGAYLQARKRFVWPALAPLLSSLVVIISYRLYAWASPTLATTETVGPWAEAWLGWGTTAGVLAMALPLVLPARRAGLRLRPTLRLPRGLGRRALSLMVAGVGTVGAQQLAIALVLLLAMRAGGLGTLPVFQYAQALYLLPFAILVAPLLTSVFPHMSEQRLVGDDLGFATTVAVSLRTVVALATLGGAALFAAGPALEMFFHLIDRAGAVGVGSAAGAFALGLVPYAVATHCTRVLSAALRARDALLVGSVGWIVAGVMIIVVTLTSPTRRAPEAATAFALCIALGMLVAALVGLGRIADLMRPSGQGRRVAFGLGLGLVGMPVGAVPGLLVGRLLLHPGMSELPIVVIGILSALVAAIIVLGLAALVDRDLLDRLIRHRRRRRGHPATI